MTTDITGLVAELRGVLICPSAQRDIMNRAADALTAQAAELAEARAERDSAVFRAMPLDWCDIESAPEDEHVILATTGGHVGEALMLRDEDTGRQKWTWALGPVHPSHEPLGWQPMPAALSRKIEPDNRHGGFDGPTGAD